MNSFSTIARVMWFMTKKLGKALKNTFDSLCCKILCQTNKPPNSLNILHITV